MKKATAIRSWLTRPEVVVGLVAGLALAGRTFGSGLLLNVDLVVGDRIAIPPGQFGSGVELPRRVPFFTLLAPWTWLIPGPTVVGAVLVMAVTAAVSGTARLVAVLTRPIEETLDRYRPGPIELCLGLVYGLSPMLLTRAGVGHLPLVVATALLPWAALSLQKNSAGDKAWTRSLAWGSAFALTGSAGSLLGLILIAAFVVSERSSVLVRLRRLLALAATQAIWLLPGLAVLGTGSALPTTGWQGFATRITDFGNQGSIEGSLALAAGGGFFARAEDVARGGLGATARLEVTIYAAALSLLFVMGVAMMARQRRVPGTKALWAAGVIGSVLVLAPVVPGLRLIWDVAMSWPVASVVREPQKFWPLAGLLIVVGVGWVLHRLPSIWAGRVAVAVLTGLALATAWPGLWGASGRLVVADKPEPWVAIENRLAGETGRLAVFPWRRYHFLDLSQGRNVVGPAPWLLTSFEGSFVTSGDPGFNDGGSERAENLEQQLDALDTKVRAARPIVPELQQLGIRWLLVEGSPEIGFYRRIGGEADTRVWVDEGNYLLVEVFNHKEWQLSDIQPLNVALSLIGVVLTCGLGVSGWLAKLR